MSAGQRLAVVEAHALRRLARRRGPLRWCGAVRTKIPQRSISRSSISPPSSSSCAFISVLLAWITVTCRPRSASTLAASRPEQAAAEHDGAVAGARVGAHPRAVVHGPVDEDAGSQFAAGGRHARRAAAPAAGCRWRAPRRRSGGARRRRSRCCLAAVSSRLTTPPSCRRTPCASYQAARLGDDRRRAPPRQHLAEQDPVVGAASLLAEDDDLVAQRAPFARPARRAGGRSPSRCR